MGDTLELGGKVTQQKNDKNSVKTRKRPYWGVFIIEEKLWKIVSGNFSSWDMLFLRIPWTFLKYANMCWKNCNLTQTLRSFLSWQSYRMKKYWESLQVWCLTENLHVHKIIMFLMFIYGAVPMKESWVEIYKIPRETWIKELETAMAAAVRSRKPTLAESSAPVSLKDVFLKKFFPSHAHVKQISAGHWK